MEQTKFLHSGDFPSGPVAKTPQLPMQVAWVCSLVRELDFTWAMKIENPACLN